MNIKCILVLSSCFLTLLLLFLLLQNYLAKNNQMSPMYWRNYFLIFDTVFQWAHYRYVDNFLTLAQIYMAGYFTLRQKIVNFFHLKKFHDLKTVISKLDDRIDNAPVAEVHLSYQLIKEIYPKETQVGVLMQMFHDTLEFRLDLRQEINIGKITPNYFLAQLERKTPAV